ncbi:MAG: hypothetical protein WCF65_07340 [Parachlamydiaceae bacterium]
MNESNLNNENNQIFFQFPSTISKTSTPQVSRHLFTTTLSSKLQRFDDLEIFRQEIEESRAGLHHQPYSSKKNNVLVYKLVFFGFSLLFFALGIAATWLPSAISCGLLFGTCTFLKGAVLSICILLSLTSFIFCLTLQARREAVLEAVRRAKLHLKSILVRKQIRMGLKRFVIFFGEQRTQAAALVQMYHDGIEKINDKKDEAIHLVHRIATAQTLDKKEKETLLNQAIEELDEKLRVLIHSFRHAVLPFNCS